MPCAAAAVRCVARARSCNPALEACTQQHRPDEATGPASLHHVVGVQPQAAYCPVLQYAALQCWKEAVGLKLLPTAQEQVPAAGILMCDSLNHPLTTIYISTSHPHACQPVASQAGRHVWRECRPRASLLVLWTPRGPHPLHNTCKRTQSP